jgi:phospholipid-binding lipoprotein MlaA
MSFVICRFAPPVQLALALGAIFASVLNGCATAPPPNDPEAIAEYHRTNDPLEPANRVFYKISDVLDSTLVAPIARMYRLILPIYVRTGVHNALANLTSPVTLANDLLEGKPDRAADTTLRFLVNTTFGLGGLIDVGRRLSIPGHNADFGLTLGYWGVPEGPFLYLPILGPSDPRDVVGFGVDILIDPFTWVDRGTAAHNVGTWTREGVTILDERTRLLDTIDEIKKTALDPYATFRSLYRQSRASELRALRASDQSEIYLWPRAANLTGTAR